MKTLICSAAALLVAGAVSAETVSFSDSIALTGTNWQNTISLNKFDASLGTLNSVTLMLTGELVGNADVESRDAAPAQVTINLQGMITASVAPASLSVDVAPLATQGFAATVFDGSIDFGGTSGASYVNLSASDDDSATSNDFAFFTGAGTFDVDLAATAVSTATGAGNIVTQFSTQAAATATVVYDYTVDTPAVPLPAGLPMLGAALAGLAMVRRRS